MYDPSEEFELTQEFEGILTRMESLKANYPDGHVFHEVVDISVGLLETLNHIRDDYNNCFDPEEKRKLLKVADEVVVELRNFISRIIAVVKEQKAVVKEQK